ncbi:uncharacterized protein LOC101208978 isoform X3 [Cucumis sativus]|uniref:uncharacterized protein LOC101208978 isoform X3 n=1 Tax=Cucumis sativus TaxID=3659 RepID=UPI0012F489E9|nr:uncharacterized protein LOC101208978 isoform X3 [Cucumis sativus]
MCLALCPARLRTLPGHSCQFGVHSNTNQQRLVLRNSSFYGSSEMSEVPCAIKPVSEGDQSTACNGTFVDRPICVGDQNEVLEKSQLEAIASSSEIHNILNDEKLQKFILAIDSSPDPETEVDKAMEDEAFRIFSSKISSIINS